MSPHRLPLIAGLFLLTGCLGRGRELSPIALDTMPTIGDVTGQGAMTSWPRVSALHPLGYRVLVPQPSGAGGAPLVYGDDGRFLGALGTTDSASGSLVEPLFARIGPGDSTWVFDGAGGANVYAPDRTYVRRVSLPTSPWDAAVLADGRIVVASSSSRAPLPLLLLTAEGTLVREIGTPLPGEPLGTMRRITIGPDGTIWTVAMLGSWRIEQWDTLGASVGVVAREPEWFPPYDSYQAPAPGTPPQPALQAAWFDTAGKLWVLGKAVDADWESGVGALPATGTEPGASVISDPDRVYDTVIEVIDPATGELVTMARFDITWPFTAEPGVLMRVVTTAGGWHRAALARVRMAAEGSQ